VERHGGRIWIEPSVGGGITVCFTISGAERQLEGSKQNELRIPAHAH
jgi:signal transduction histidine kinase